MLVRQQIDLARQEITAALTARVSAAIGLAVGAVCALLALIFLLLAGTAALDLVMPAWAARLIAAGALLVIAAAAMLFGRSRLRRPPLVPPETTRTLKEDVAWAKAQLRR